MPSLQDNSEKISGIETTLVVMDYRLTATEGILSEIKDALKDLVVINQENKKLKEDIANLREDFEERKRLTDPIIEKGNSIISRFYGGVSVIVLLIGLLTYIGSGSLTKLDEVHGKTSRQEIQIQLLERDFQYYHSLPRDSERQNATRMENHK